MSQRYVASLLAEVTAALTQTGTLRSLLQMCAEAIVNHLDASFARIWILDDGTHLLHLLASAGKYTHLDGPHGCVAVGELKIGLIAAERRPHLTNTVVGDPRVSDQEWAKQEGMVAFAGYPLVVADRVVGVMALFAKHELEQSTLSILESISAAIAVGIERVCAEEERDLARKQVELEREHLRSLLMQAPASIAILHGPDHIHELVNPRYFELAGYRQYLGRRAVEVFSEREFQGIISILDDVYTSGKPFIATDFQISADRDGSGSLDDKYFNIVFQPTFEVSGNVAGIMIHAVEVTAQVRSHQHVQRLAAERAAILGQITEGLIMADATGRIVYENDAAHRMLGRSGLDSSIGSYSEVYGFVTPDGAPYPPEDLPLVRAIVHQETVVNVPLQVRLNSGSEIVLEASASPVLTEHQLLGGVVTFRDVTERWELERQKEVFLASAAHDLRTPLTSIKGMAQFALRRLVRDESLDLSKLTEPLRSIDNTATRMGAMINDLLDVTRAEMGHSASLQCQPTDLVALLQEKITELRYLHDKHVVSWRTDCECLIGAWDRERLERIFGNLLTNAVKFSPAGGHIEVAVAGRVDDNLAVVSISDQGVGIPADNLPHIFERFYRGRNTGDWVAGTGIGLASVRQLVEMHAGTVDAISEEGLGSTFTVRLPLTSRVIEQ